MAWPLKTPNLPLQTNARSLFSALDRALSDYSTDPEAWARLSAANMAADLGWGAAGAEYVERYAAVVGAA